MTLSFRDAAERIDPEDPPARLRGDDGVPEEPDDGLLQADEKGLAQLHRWQPSEYEDGEYLSLRATLERHAEGENRRLLSLNTWLVPAVTFEIALYNAVTSAGHEVADLFEDIDGSDDMADKYAVAETEVSINGQSDRGKRLEELAGALDDGSYDVVGLCELLTPEQRATLRSQMEGLTKSGDRSDDQQGIGPRADDVSIEVVVPGAVSSVDVQGEDAISSSGLYTITPGDAAIRDVATHTYTEKGYLLRDISVFANKGVLYTAVDLAPESDRELVVDYFSTHVLAGDTINVDELPDAFEEYESEVSAAFENVTQPGNEKPVSYYKRRQVEELKKFVADRSHDDRVTIVGGDFNIAANEPHHEDLYEFLVGELGELGLVDCWPIRGGEVGSTAHPHKSCAFDDGGTAPYFCDDDAVPEAETARIDYLFVERPKDDHAYDLDCSRVRRRPFWRGGDSTDEKLDYLTDHLGLDVELIVSPN